VSVFVASCGATSLSKPDAQADRPAIDGHADADGSVDRNDALATNEVGAPDAETCPEISDEDAAALASVRRCDPTAPSQCGHLVPASLYCGCQDSVTDSSAVDAIAARFHDAGCTFASNPLGGCVLGCLVFPMGTCEAQSNGAFLCTGQPAPGT
jgi:hypothetical protein